MTRMHWIAVGGLAGGLVLLLVLGWQFLLKPLGVDYDAKVAQRVQLEEQLKTTKQRAMQFEKFKAQAENVRRDLDFYTRRLDSDLPASELYTLVDGMGHSLGLSEWAFSTKDRIKTKTAGLNLDEVEVTAKFNSDFDHLGRFINACVSQTRMLVPEGLKLLRKTDTNGVYADTLSAEVTFKVFVSEDKP